MSWYWLTIPKPECRYVHALDTAERTIDVPGREGLTLELDALWRERWILGGTTPLEGSADRAPAPADPARPGYYTFVDRPESKPFATTMRT